MTSKKQNISIHPAGNHSKLSLSYAGRLLYKLVDGETSRKLIVNKIGPIL